MVTENKEEKKVLEKSKNTLRENQNDYVSIQKNEMLYNCAFPD